MFKNLFDIKSQVIGLTGGGGYLGREMALGLSSMGADVFICGREEQKLKKVADESQEKGFEGRIFYQTLDVTDKLQLEQFLEFILSKGGKITGWINNAASGTSELQGEMTREGVNNTLDSCLTQVLLGTQAAANKMTLSEKGSIVNISSMYGIVSPPPDLYKDYPEFHNPPAYGAAKAGIIQYTKYAASHLAKSNIRVNCVSPGPFPKENIQKESGFVQELKARVPLNRTGTSVDLVGPVIFLLSHASSYITGHNLVVDGGWTVW